FHSYIAKNEEATAIYRDVAMVGLNSARRASLHWDWSLGSVSHRQRTRVADVLRSHGRHAFRIVALHHPMIHSEARAGKQLVGGATRALDAWARAGADVIVHGHGHLPRVQLVDSATRSLIIMQSGSSLGVRLRGEPGGYNVLDFLGPSQVGVSMRTKESSAYAQGEAKLFVRNAVGWHTLKRHSSGPSGSIAIAREATHLFASTSKADLIARASSHNHHTR
ncbi:MAG TPA: hypothetical protein VNA21_08810, partial [Steroidobacteraceae bacterium]|nr:hypothetical protein [Steroidobacteraceae bacterium]